MERNEFLLMCQRCAKLPGRLFGIRENVPESDRVIYDGNLYYPVAYELSFDDRGFPRHIAILHDMKANSISRAPLDKVIEATGKETK